jgi:hypothetical protein
MASLSLVEDAETEHRILLYQYIKEEIWTVGLVHDLRLALAHIVDFTMPCDDHFKLVGVIPLMVTLARLRPCTILRAALSAILNLITSIGKIPDDLEGYPDYLRAELSAAYASDQDEDVLISFVEFLPPFMMQLYRLAPRRVKIVVLGFTSIFTVNNVRVFKVFAKALKAVNLVSASRLMKPFLYGILVAVNYPSEEFIIEIIGILMEIYSATDVDALPLWAKSYADNVTVICMEMSSRNSSETLHLALFQFLELLLRREIVDPVKAFDWASIVLPYLSAPDPMIQYWIMRLIRVFPDAARSRFEYAFYFEGPTRLKPQARPPLLSPPVTLKEEKLISFNYNSRTKFNPKFLSSSHIDKVHVRHMMNLEDGDRFVIVDSQNRISLLALPTIDPTAPPAGWRVTTMALRDLQDSVFVSCTLPSELDFILGFENGGVSKYDIQARTLVQLGAIANKKVTAMEPVLSKNLLMGSSDGHLSLLDPRESSTRPVNSMFFQKFSMVTSISVWPNSEVAAAVGFSIGAATIVDLRTWMPIWSDKTRSISQILPMALDTPGLSYCVVNDETVEIVIEPRIRPRIRARTAIAYHENGLFRKAFSFLGGALVLDDISASFVHAVEGQPLVRLFDMDTAPLQTQSDEVGCRILSSQENKSSLHKHDGIITCGVQTNDTIITCDDIGFVHRWKIEGRARPLF